MPSLIQEFKDSIKSPDTEEKLDLAFYRPMGFIIAKVAHLFHMGPSALSLLGLFSGWGAAYFFYQYNQADNSISSLLPTSSPLTYFLWATVLFLLSGIFDSSDGQLARISGQSSKLGLILDGICDSLVTISIYVAGTIPFILQHGWLFAIFSIVALLFHSNQCAILDFYHREYAFFGYGKTEGDTYWNPSVEEALKTIEQAPTTKERVMNKLRLNWIKQQQMLSTRTTAQRIDMRKIVTDLNHPLHSKLKEEYRRLNKPMLPVWRLIGTNAHTVMLIIAFYFHRFDLGLLIFDFFIFNLVILIAAQLQKRQDRKLFTALQIK